MSLSLKFLTVAVFLLTCVPRMNISVGPIPVYLIDVCLFGSIWYGGMQRSSHLGAIPHAGFCICILSFATLSELLSMLYLGTYVQTAYMVARLCLSVSIFFLVNNLIQKESDLIPLLKAAVLGMLITAFLMAMTSLPGTRGTVAWLFSIDFLSPVGEFFFKTSADLARGTRGQSLVGYNIISAWFVALIWPLAIVLYRASSTQNAWKSISLLASILGPFGVIFSYSRGAILGLLLILTTLLLFGESKVKGQIALVIAVGALIIGTAGLDSEHFYFERIERRTMATIENPFDNEMESERFASYIDPFLAAGNNPILVFLGEGLTRSRVKRRGGKVSGSLIVMEDRNMADHSVFAMATFNYGMVAAFCYIGLWASSTLRAFSEARATVYSDGTSRFFPQLIFGSVLGLSAWVAFDKGIVMQPRGATMFFLITGLVGVCQNLRNVKSGPTSDDSKHPISSDPIADLYR